MRKVGLQASLAAFSCPHPLGSIGVISLPEIALKFWYWSCATTSKAHQYVCTRELMSPPACKGQGGGQEKERCVEGARGICEGKTFAGERYEGTSSGALGMHAVSDNACGQGKGTPSMSRRMPRSSCSLVLMYVRLFTPAREQFRIESVYSLSPTRYY